MPLDYTQLRGLTTRQLVRALQGDGFALARQNEITPKEFIPMSNTKDKTMRKTKKTIVVPTAIWQEWAKERAKNAPSLKQVHEITKKVKINVTQLILEERRVE